MRGVLHLCPPSCHVKDCFGRSVVDLAHYINDAVIHLLHCEVCCRYAPEA